jgi:hypothetical protein
MLHWGHRMAMIGAVKLASAAYHAGSKINAFLGYTAETIGIGRMGTVSTSNHGGLMARSRSKLKGQREGPL